MGFNPENGELSLIGLLFVWSLNVMDVKNMASMVVPLCRVFAKIM